MANVRIDVNSDVVARSDNQVNTNLTDKQQSKSDAMSIVRNQIATQLAQATLSQSKQIISMSIANYGSATGNYFEQERLENIISASETAISFAVSTASSFMINPVLAVVNLGIQAVSQGINIANNMYNYQLSLNNRNAQASFNSANLGLILTNGSR